MVFFHKYFLFKRKFPDIFTKYLSCFTCLFLSLKVCDCLMPLDNLISIFLKLLFKIQNINPVEIYEKIVKETKERVFQIEFEILDLIGFDLNIDMPYIYLQKMSYYFKNCVKAEKLTFCTTSFLNDSFKLPLCLFYDPLVILLACVYLCEFYFNVKLLDHKGVKWYQIVNKNVDFDIVKEIFVKLKFNYDCSSANKHIKDFEFDNMEFLNKSILDFDLDKFYNRANEIKNEQNKNKIEFDLNKDLVIMQDKNEIKEKNTSNKEESHSSEESGPIKDKENLIDCTKNAEDRLILDLNEEEKEKPIMKNRNKDNRYKKLKINNENIPKIKEKDINFTNNIDKNEVNNSFSNYSTALQESNFVNDI